MRIDAPLREWLRTLTRRSSLLYERLAGREQRDLREVAMLSERLGRLAESHGGKRRPKKRSLKAWGDLIVEDRSPRPRRPAPRRSRP